MKWGVSLVCLFLLAFEAPFPAQGQEPSLPSQAYDFHFTKGVVAFDLGNYPEARDQFIAAVGARPGDARASYYLGLSYTRLQAYDEAEKTLAGLLARDPSFQKAGFDLGVAQYFLGKHEEALKQFAQAESFDPENPLVFYYQGLTLNKLGQYEQAPPRFLKAMLLDPALTASARYNNGVAYFRLGLNAEAKEAFEAVIAAEPQSSLGRSAVEFLGAIKKPEEVEEVKEKPKPWTVSLTVSPQYDDNVILQAPGGILPEGISRQQDYRTTTFGRAELKLLETEAFTFGSSYSVYQSFHVELDEFDVQSHSPTVFAAYQLGRVNARLDYKFDYFTVGRESYMAGHTLNPNVMVAEPKDMFTQIQYRYQAKAFIDDPVFFPENSDRDGPNHMTGFTQFLLFAERQGNARIGYSFDADLTRGPSWDYQGHRFAAGVTSPPLWTLRFDASFDYYFQNYQNPNEFSPTFARRRDDVLTTTLTVTKQIGSSLSLALQYLYNRNQSNVPVFDFNRNIVSILASAQF